jgi:hypothetical protein
MENRKEKRQCKKQLPFRFIAFKNMQMLLPKSVLFIEERKPEKMLLKLRQRKLTNGEMDSQHLHQPLLNKDTQSSIILLPMIKKLTPGLINKPISVTKLPFKVTPLQIILLNNTLMLSLRVHDL